MFRLKFVGLIVFLVLFLVIAPARTYAYLDPGTGSYFVQILIATLAGGTYLIVASWGKIKQFLNNFISRFKKDGKTER